MAHARCSIELQTAAIELSSLQRRLDDPDTGAHGWFLGVTRRKTVTPTQGVRTTRTLFYEAHRAMAEAQLRQLAQTAAEQFSLSKVVIVHRLGEVPIAQASVAVGCSAAHRSQVFAAIPWIMDRLKRDVPIWKREHFEDDSTEWVHPTSSEGP